MDKQKDFEKGWEEYKAKKKQQIEEMEKTLYEYRFSYDDCIAGSETYLAKYLIEKGWIKPTENAVVIPKEISCYDNVRERIKTFKLDGNKVDFTDEQIIAITNIFHYKEMQAKEIRKETAEKFAAGVKKRTINWFGEMGFFLTYEELDEILKKTTEGKK